MYIKKHKMTELLWSIFKCVSTRVLGPFLVCAFCVLAVVLVYTYAAFLFGYACGDNVFLQVFNVLMAVWVVPNILFNYYRTVRTSPGTTAILADPKYKDTQSKKWCKICNQIKPPRTHHCRSCGVCVLKMDHHCPWINNCVGHYNHQYFELFVSYTFIGVSYFNLLMYRPFMAAVYETDPVISGDTRAWMIAVGAISLTCGLALLAFFVWNLYLVSSAQTTIEVAINSAEEIKVHPYDFGRAQNIRNFFGGRNWQDIAWLICIPQMRTPQGDGVTWEVRQECVGMMDDYEDMV